MGETGVSGFGKIIDEVSLDEWIEFLNLKSSFNELENKWKSFTWGYKPKFHPYFNPNKRITWASIFKIDKRDL